MAKFHEVGEDVQDIFADKVADADLERLVNVKVLGDNRQKTIGKVQKANPLLKHMTGEDVIIILNEKIFDGLESDQKILVADELVTYIHANGETGAVNIVKPDVSTFSGVIRKYTFEVYERLNETIKSLYDKENNDKTIGESDD